MLHDVVKNIYSVVAFFCL